MMLRLTSQASSPQGTDSFEPDVGFLTMATITRMTGHLSHLEAESTNTPHEGHSRSTASD